MICVILGNNQYTYMKVIHTLTNIQTAIKAKSLTGLKVNRSFNMMKR